MGNLVSQQFSKGIEEVALSVASIYSSVQQQSIL